MRRGLEERTKGWRNVTQLLDSVRAARVVLVLIVGAIGSLPLVVLTPPFQVPDEVQHFYRAYQLSEFHIRAEVQDGVAGGTLPISLPQLVNSSVYSADGVKYPATPASIIKTLKLASMPLNVAANRFVAFPNSAFYSPLPYLPQILGIAAGRAIGLGPLYLLYLGRLFNCLAALGLVALAFNSMPDVEEIVLLTGLLPMSLYLYASLSPDAVVIASALVFSALSYAASVRGNWITWELWVAAAAGAFFCSVKPVYAPLLLAAVVPGILRNGRTAQVIRSHVILLGVALGVTAGWLLFAKSTMTALVGGGNPSQQFSLIAHHPALLFRVIVNAMGLGSLVNLYVQAIGIFGWLTVWLKPGIFYVLPLVGILVIRKRGFRNTSERSVSRALWCLALCFASAVLVIIALYLICAQVGQESVTGLQGRYFIPIFCIAGVAAIELDPSRRTSAPRWKILTSMAGIILVQTIVMDISIIRGFHVF